MLSLIKKRKIRITVLVCIVINLLAILGARQWIELDTRSRIHSSTENIPERQVGLVLGCAPHLYGGQSNFYFLYRMQATSKLFAEGKIKHIIVSGDNHVHTYNESKAMKEALIRLGVPADRIVCDYAGFSTLDSVVRARDIFGQSELTIISQEFHAQRAVFIARRKGMDAIGFCAQDLSTRASLRTSLREELARVKTVLDLYVLNRQPRFLGEPIQIGLELPHLP